MKNLPRSEVGSPCVVCRRIEEVMVFLYNKGKYLYSGKCQLISMCLFNTPTIFSDENKLPNSAYLKSFL